MPDTQKVKGAHKLQDDVCPSVFPPPVPNTLLLFPTPTAYSMASHDNINIIMFPLSFFLCILSSVCDLPCSSLFLSKANSTSMGQLDKLVSPGIPALTPESEEERSFPPQRVSTFRPRPYSMADSNKVRDLKERENVSRVRVNVNSQLSLSLTLSLLLLYYRSQQSWSLHQAPPAGKVFSIVQVLCL